MTRFRETVSALPAGRAFARAAIALAATRDAYGALDYAKTRWNDSPDTIDHLEKTAVSAGTSDVTAWGSALIPTTFAGNQFAARVEQGSIIGRMQGTRRLPFNVAYPAETTAALSVEWLGSAVAIPVSAGALNQNTLGMAMVGALTVVSKELLRSADPAAEATIQAMLERAAVAFLDQQFIDPGIAAISNVRPASILNSATNIVQATGSTALTVAANLATVAGTMADNDSLGQPYWIMSRATAVKLAALRDTAGSTAFPGVRGSGGELFGIPILVSNSVPSSVSAGSIIALVDASQIDVALGTFEVAASEQAAIEMDDAPSGDAGTPTGSQMVSMFGTDSAAIRLTCTANWRRVRTEAVGYTDNLHL
jgi:HK97 family phage major capsid protein